jgi:hypothetical protein
MKLLYLCFWEGKDIYYQTLISICSALKYYSANDIILYSEDLQFFDNIDWINKVYLTQEIIQKRLWDSDYIYRLKITCFKDALENYEQAIVFIDSDTFIKGILPNFSQWESLMHIREANFNPTYSIIHSSFGRSWFGWLLLGEWSMYNSW